MKYLVRFEVECIIDVDDDENPNDLGIVAQAVKESLIATVTDDVKIKPCHVELLEDEEE